MIESLMTALKQTTYDYNRSGSGLVVTFPHSYVAVGQNDKGVEILTRTDFPDQDTTIQNDLSVTEIMDILEDVNSRAIAYQASLPVEPIAA